MSEQFQQTTLDALDPAGAVIGSNIIYTQDAEGNDQKATMQQVKDFVKPAAASVNNEGLVNTAAQSFAGKKTFNNGVATSSLEAVNVSVSDEYIKTSTGTHNIIFGSNAEGNAIAGPLESPAMVVTVNTKGTAGQLLGIGADGKPLFVDYEAPPAIFYAVCDVAADVQIKTIQIPSLLAIPAGSEVRVKFINGSTVGSCAGTDTNLIAEANAPYLAINNFDAKPIKVGGEYAGENFVRAGDIHSFIYDGESFTDITADVIYQGETTAGSYVKKRNGLIKQWNTEDVDKYKTITMPIRYTNSYSVTSNVNRQYSITSSDGTFFSSYIYKISLSQFNIKSVIQYGSTTMVEDTSMCWNAIGK